MSIFISSIITSGVSGFLTAWVGILIGIVSSSFMKSRGRRFKGTILGFLGGLTLGIVCFDLLPEAFNSGNIYIAIIGITAGIILSVILDGKLDNNNNSLCKNSFYKAAIFMAIGIGIHNLPSGVALGSLILASPENGFYLAIALILHGIPEGFTLGIFFRECNTSKLKLILISILTSIPLGFGAILGTLIRAPAIICISLGFAAAMILYVTLRETLPSANDFWGGRVTTIGNLIGIVIGLLMVSILH